MSSKPFSTTRGWKHGIGCRLTALIDSRERSDKGVSAGQLSPSSRTRVPRRPRLLSSKVAAERGECDHGNPQNDTAP
jgi:hypothetical protein